MLQIDNRVIALRLKNLRCLKEKSQREISKDLSLSKGAWSNYESGIRVPRDDMKEKIAEYFGVSIEEIFYGKATKEVSEVKDCDYYIYAIQHNKTNKIYIGGTENVQNRYIAHLNNLKSGKHPSKEMQEDFNKYGEDYSVYILEKVDNPNDYISSYAGNRHKKSRIKEYEWMEKYNTINNGYNLQDITAIRFIENKKKATTTFPLKEGKPYLPQ